MDKVAVKFKADKGSAKVGETHSYEPDVAKRLVEQGVAEYVQVKASKARAKD